MDQPSKQTPREQNNRIATLEQELEQLRREHAMLLQTLDYLDGALIVVTMDARITLWNQAAERLYGWAAAEVLGRPMNEVLSHRYPDGSSTADALNTLMQHRHWHGQVLQPHRDGRELLLVSSVYLVVDEQGSPVMMVAVNRLAGD